jgi:hypothetical protein
MHYNCLIVDDEVELAKMTAEYFQMFDIKTEYVDSASACYEFLDKNDIDLLLFIICNLGISCYYDFVNREEPYIIKKYISNHSLIISYLNRIKLCG